MKTSSKEIMPFEARCTGIRCFIVLALVICIYAGSALCVYADQEYAYTGDYFCVNFEYMYIGNYGDQVSRISLFGSVEEMAEKGWFTPYVHFDGIKYLQGNSEDWSAYIKLPPYEAGKKLTIDGVPKPEGYDIAWNAPYSVILGELPLDYATFGTPQNLYTLMVPLVREGEKVSFAENTSANISVSVLNYSNKYTGKVITPDVLVWYNGLILKKGTDYRVTYKNNINPGKAAAVVTGIGIFKGTIQKEYEIYKLTVYPTGVRIKNAPTKLLAGTSAKLSANVKPGDASDKKVIWKSSNPKYATVSSAGVVKALKAGIGKTVTIKAITQAAKNQESKEHWTDSVKIKITGVKNISATAPKKLKVGKSAKIKVKVTALTAAAKKVSFRSSNTKYATVSSKGVVKAKKAGKGKLVVITVKAKDGSGKSTKVKIRITK